MTVADDAAVDLLTNMLRIPSLCGEEDEVAELLCTAIIDAGFDAHRDDVGNVVGTFGAPEATRSLLFLGHMDTVPGMVPVERRDGVLYGRGAVDAKGPLATGIVAATRASANTELRITVIGAVQEEGPSIGARYLASTMQAPDFLVIGEPGGWDSVVLGYKGSVRFTITIAQPSAHTAGRELSAPELAVQYWNRLTAWCVEQTPNAEGAFNQLTASLISMNSQNDGLQTSATLHIGLRLPPGVSVECAREGAQSLQPDAIFEFAMGEEAVRSGKSNHLVAGFIRSIRAEDGTPRFKVKTGTADMNVVGPVWRCPMVAYGPGDSNLDHTPNEHIKVEEYLRAIRVLTRVFEEL